MNLSYSFRLCTWGATDKASEPECNSCLRRSAPEAADGQGPHHRKTGCRRRFWAAPWLL